VDSVPLVVLEVVQTPVGPKLVTLHMTAVCREVSTTVTSVVSLTLVDLVLYSGGSVLDSVTVITNKRGLLELLLLEPTLFIQLTSVGSVMDVGPFLTVLVLKVLSLVTAATGIMDMVIQAVMESSKLHISDKYLT